MKTFTFRRTILAAMIAATALLPVGNTSAAIACQPLDIIEAPDDMMIPMIFLELPRPLDAALSRGQAADRTGATEHSNEDAGPVVMAAENQFRCLNNGQDVMFAGNSTPQQRVNMFAVPDIDDGTQYIDIESLHVVEMGEAVELTDGRFLVDFTVVVDGNQLLTGELVFLEDDGHLYLDGSFITDSAELNEEPVKIELSTTFTREVKVVEANNGDKIIFQNTEEEASASIQITAANGETIFEGSAMGTTMVGGEDTNIFVVHNLEPGEYQILVTFSPDDVKYSATLVVTGSGAATPVSTPMASPES